MGRNHMDDRKRALVMGKFKFLYQDDAEDLEAGDKFQLALVQNKLLGPVRYQDKDGKDPEVLNIYGKEREVGGGFSDPDIKIPGVLDLFTVVWSNPFGDLFVDQDIKFFEFVDVQKYSSYNDGPKSVEFCQFYTNSKSQDLDGFDSSIFWSAGMLFKNFKTCGVEKWDIEFRELVPHYRNWREWSHEVHNKPDKDGSRKYSDNPYSGPASTSSQYNRGLSSNNNSKAPLLTSTPNKPQPMIHYNPALVPPPSLPPPSTQVLPPPTLLSAPTPGQTIAVPIQGPEGNTIQVQLVTIPADHPPGTPIMLPTVPQPVMQQEKGAASRFKYINPAIINTSQPPPGYPASGENPAQQSSWTSAVDEFLYRKPKNSNGDTSSTAKSRSPPRSPVPSRLKSPPRTTNKKIKLVGNDLDALREKLAARLAEKSGDKLESLRKVKVGGKRKVTLEESEEPKEKREGKRTVTLVPQESEESSPLKKKRKWKVTTKEKVKSEDEKPKKKFRPRAVISPPSPSGGMDVNELDISPEETLYSGEILEWRSHFGFITCDSIYGKIFVHQKDVVENVEHAEVGAGVTFQVLHQESSKVGAKAVNVKVILA